MCMISNDHGFVMSSPATLEVVETLPIGVALNAPEFEWTMGGMAPWITQTTNTFDGRHAVLCRLPTRGGAAFLETTLKGPGLLEWAWAIEGVYSHTLEFYINNGWRTSIRERCYWSLANQYIPPGTNRVRWVYSAYDSNGVVYLDQVRFAPYYPVITCQPSSQFVLPSSNVTFCVEATGLSQLAYQWWFNGSPLEGATNACLTLDNVQPQHAGEYYVVVANQYGTATSAVARLVLRTLWLETGGEPKDGMFPLVAV